MAKAKLIINNEREIPVNEGVTSIGRTTDNQVSLSEDANVSRYHAEIEARADEFWLFELGSSNGTTLNGEKVYSEKLLKNGDVIVLGGTSEIVFELENHAPPAASSPAKDSAAPPSAAAPNVSVPETPSAPAAAAVPAPEIAADAAKTSKMPMMLAIAGIVCGLAVICVIAAVVVSLSGGSKCEAKATIISPESGDMISKETEIEIESENADCVKRAIFLLDGVEFASATEAPFTVSLDPKQLAEYSDEGDHSLKVAFEDEEGNKTIQPGEVLVGFETLSTPTPTPEPTETPDEKPTPKKPEGKQASPNDTQEMSRNLLKEFSGNSNYKFDPQFLQEVQKKTSEYAVEGYFARAVAFQDTINIEFHKVNALDAPLGHILAMSRSQFKPQKQGSEEGLWRLSDGFVTGNNYKASCLTDSLSDATQNCAAKTAAIYTKALVLKIFEGKDIVYAVSAFGMSEQEAIQWQSTLPADRSDFWKVIKTPQQRDQLVRFFAAGIVAENPQKFGLKKDRPISDLYRNLMGR